MGEHAKITYVTEEELRAQINEIEAKYPRIPELAANSDCGGCAASAVADEYGWEVANNEYEDWDVAQWLLGEDK